MRGMPAYEMSPPERRLSSTALTPPPMSGKVYLSTSTERVIHMTDFLTETLELEAKAASYGVQYEGTLVGHDYHSQVESGHEYTLAELKAEGGRITRMRFIGGDYIPGRGKCYDISYIHGMIGERTVRISLSYCDNWNLIPRRNLKKAMIDWAKAEGVYAKGLGMLDDGNYSILG